jgi:hypothetical protein
MKTKVIAIIIFSIIIFSAIRAFALENIPDRISGDGSGQRDLIFSPTEVHFGDVLTDETRSQLFEFTSTWPIPITIDVYVGIEDGSINLTHLTRERLTHLHFSLQPMITELVQLDYTPQQVGPWTNTLVVYDNSTGINYEIFLDANNIPGPSLFISPSDINFGNVFPDTYYYSMMDVQNQSGSTLNIGHYVTGDDGSVNLNLVGKTWEDSLNYSIGPGETKQVEIRFAISELGPLEAFICVDVVETGEQYQIPLNANVVPPLYINPPGVDFGIVHQGQTYTQMIDLQNGSSSTMEIGHYVTGDDGSVNLNLIGRTRTDSLYYLIPPGQTEQVQLEYTPQSFGPWGNVMFVHDFVSNATYTIPMNAMVEPYPPVLHIDSDAGSIRLFWDYNPDATSFTVYQSYAPEGPFIPIMVCPPSQTELYIPVELNGFFRLTYEEGL